MQNMQYIKNEVKDFAWNVFIILVSKTFYSVSIYIFISFFKNYIHLNWHKSDSILEAKRNLIQANSIRIVQTFYYSTK